LDGANRTEGKMDEWMERRVGGWEEGRVCGGWLSG
jgi:hypothetical protein